MKQKLQLDNKLIEIIKNFENSGEVFIEGNRNKIKLFDFNGIKINVKSFKTPNFFNKIIYNFFRASKAKRSYNFANILLQKGIGTPKPIAYYEKFSFIGLEKSFYVSEHLEFDLMFRDLVDNENYPNYELIIKQFATFCFQLHQSGIEFLDHSPGNTLIKKNDNNDYAFYLVDLNRMKFHDQMSFETRMKNLSRLTSKKKMTAEIAKEYAAISGDNETIVFETLWKLTSKFQYKFYRKKRIKKVIKFWN